MSNNLGQSLGRVKISLQCRLEGANCLELLWLSVAVQTTDWKGVTFNNASDYPANGLLTVTLV